ncbi:MAG: hypothetical protein DWI24_11560 [Planctomycetota bacterium]|nr:MAG: hypothetical protein DWI24_11560 [Planctomycetota bacterium]
MLNKSKWIRPALVAGLLSLSAGSSQAQYGGFGGWGGWGGGASTPMQGAGIGMGAMAMGEGQYKVDSSMARSMNVDTNLRLSQAMAQSQHYMNWTNMLHRERKSKANITAIDGIQKRLHETPNEVDIRSGDALNAALEDVSDPQKVHPSQLRLSNIPLEPEDVKSLPLFYASQAVAFTIGDLIDDEDWPLLLRANVYKPYRENLAKAMKACEDASLGGQLTPDLIDNVNKAVAAVDTAFQQNAKYGDPGLVEAKAQISSLKKLTKMLSTPNYEEILSTIEKAKKNNVQSTVTDLIGFMKHFNLRFGAAKTEKQAQALMDLYPNLDKIRDEVLAQTREATPQEMAIMNKPLAQVLDKLQVDDKTPAAPKQTPEPKSDSK